MMYQLRHHKKGIIKKVPSRMRTKVENAFTFALGTYGVVLNVIGP
ncbi:hypothetical protein EDD30_5969 [Couchioplanes caeruleus]|uniref:Uncharacterized protein n=1 Tax=Couchioplanes caeruleus TaxID=56438 RepID=A0A3N1GRX6_9ACTN|nr:hypothetical protein EDD30_5969 [Couchioplanes caeruleus]